MLISELWVLAVHRVYGSPQSSCPTSRIRTAQPEADMQPLIVLSLSFRIDSNRSACEILSAYPPYIDDTDTNALQVRIPFASGQLHLADALSLIPPRFEYESQHCIAEQAFPAGLITRS